MPFSLKTVLQLNRNISTVCKGILELRLMWSTTRIARCTLTFLHWCHLRLIIVHLAVVARGNFANDQCWWLAKCKHSQYWHTYIHTPQQKRAHVAIRNQRRRKSEKFLSTRKSTFQFNFVCWSSESQQSVHEPSFAYEKTCLSALRESQVRKVHKQLAGRDG